MNMHKVNLVFILINLIKKIYNIGVNTSGFSINECQYYDLTKNEWYRLPNT